MSHFGNSHNIHNFFQYYYICYGVDGSNPETVYNRNRKEFYLSQTENYSLGDTDPKAFELCSATNCVLLLQNGGLIKAKNCN